MTEKTNDKGLPMKEAAQKILEEAGGPLRSDEITKRALDGGLIKTKGKTPEATMAAQLSVAAKKGETFIRTRAGVYGLKGRDRKGAKAVEPEKAAA